MSHHALRRESAAAHEAKLHRMGVHRERGGGVSDRISDERMIEKGVHEHETAMHPGKRKTKLRFADGGGLMEGGPRAAVRQDRPAAKRGKKGHTSVNVIVAPQQGGGGPPMMPPSPPHPPMPPPGGVPGAMAGGPPMAAMPPGLPGMPHKRGGRVGKYKRQAGGPLPAGANPMNPMLQGNQMAGTLAGAQSGGLPNAQTGWQMTHPGVVAQRAAGNTWQGGQWQPAPAQPAAAQQPAAQPAAAAPAPAPAGPTQWQQNHPIVAAEKAAGNTWDAQTGRFQAGANSSANPQQVAQQIRAQNPMGAVAYGAAPTGLPGGVSPGMPGQPGYGRPPFTMNGPGVYMNRGGGIGRKRGGAVEAGAASGVGRLKKIEEYGENSTHGEELRRRGGRA